MYDANCLIQNMGQDALVAHPVSPPAGGSVILLARAAAPRKMGCPPPCLVPLVNEPLHSQHQRWTLKPSSKLCSTPLHSPAPPLSLPALRLPQPFASRYNLSLVWIHVLLLSQCPRANCGSHPDSRQPLLLQFLHIWYTRLNMENLDIDFLILLCGQLCVSRMY